MLDPQGKLRLTNNLSSMGHHVLPSDVTPTTSETPLAKTKELEDVGAEITGEDLSYMVDSAIGSLTHGVPTARVAKSNKFLNLLKTKLQRKKNQDEEVVIRGSN